MAIELPTLEEIKRITRNSLRNNFPPYEEEHKVDATLHKGFSETLLVGYKTKGGGVFEVMENTHFDLNVQENIFYLVSISLNKDERGKGLGWKLYEAVYDIARNLGFNFVIQTPSGGFIQNGRLVESREDYLLRRGHIKIFDRELLWINK